jgi:hypothetical protein
MNHAAENDPAFGILATLSLKRKSFNKSQILGYVETPLRRINISPFRKKHDRVKFNLNAKRQTAFFLYPLISIETGGAKIKQVVSNGRVRNVG